MFEPFCFMDMFISIQCKWSNKNHFQLRHITNQTSFSSSRAVTSSVCDDVGLFDFRRRRTNSEHEAETLSLSVRREAAGLLWTATRSLSFSPVQTEHLNSLQILWHHVMTSSQEDSQWPHVRRWRWFLQQKWWKSKFPARNKQIKKKHLSSKKRKQKCYILCFLFFLFIFHSTLYPAGKPSVDQHHNSTYVVLWCWSTLVFSFFFTTFQMEILWFLFVVYKMWIKDTL